jgi:hypothetical protein
MTTIEQLIDTIMQLKSVAEQAIELADEYSGGESETAEQLRDALEGIMETHHQAD